MQVRTLIQGGGWKWEDGNYAGRPVRQPQIVLVSIFFHYFSLIVDGKYAGSALTPINESKCCNIWIREVVLLFFRIPAPKHWLNPHSVIHTFSPG